MILLVGLGNPGSKYSKNRHNIGFMALDALARDANAPPFRDKFNAQFSQVEAFGQQLALLKPLTYMNLSGTSVQAAAAFLKVASNEIVVAHDELDIAFGTIRVKVDGGHAGHNGIRNMIERLSSSNFTRIRIGIGRPPPEFRGDVADYVLQDFSGVEGAELVGVVQRGADAMRLVVERGALAAMNQVNQDGRR